jgi:hypothetical protein
VSLEEWDDIHAIRGFRAVANSMETKLFATAVEDAADFGRQLFQLDRRPFFIVGARIPDMFVETLTGMIIDGRHAIAVEPDRLPEFNAVAAIFTVPTIPCGRS